MRFLYAILLAAIAMAVESNAQSSDLDSLLFDDPTKEPAATERNSGTESVHLKNEGIRRGLLLQVQTAYQQLQSGKVDESTLFLQQQILSSLKAMEAARNSAQDVGSSSDLPVPTHTPDDSPKPNQTGQPGKTDGSVADSDSAAGSEHLKNVPESTTRQWMEHRNKVLDRAWGHLPPATIERLKAGNAARFLPEYRSKIETYFKKLAELPTDEK